MTTETKDEMYADKLEAKISTLKALLREASKGINWQINGTEPMTIHEMRDLLSRIDEELTK